MDQWWYVLGASVLEDMRYKIAQMHIFSLSPTQSMQQYTKEVGELALANGTITCNTFMLPSNVRNICRNCVDELWMKHPFDLISVRMWVLENHDDMFFYQEH